MSVSAHDAQPGEQFGLTCEPVTTTQLVQYAGASDDYNRIHYDQAYAVEAGLGGVIAHGMLTMGFMGRALTQWAGPAARVRRLSARFTAPVRPGDSVVVTGTVMSREAEDGAALTVHCTLTAAVADKTVASGSAALEWAAQG